MTQEEIKSKLALTESQKELLKKFNDLLKEMRENNIGIVYDSCCGNMAFAAFNDEEVLDMDNAGWMEIVGVADGEEIDVENFVEWGNMDFENIMEYNSSFGNLHAVFGCKTSVNESMMSAAL